MAEATCVARLRATESYRTAKRHADELFQKLEDARKGGTAEKKLSASRAFVSANESLKQMEAEAKKHDEGVAAARRQLADAESTAQLAARQEEIARANAVKVAAEREANDPIRQAIRAGKVINGMTVAEAWEAVRLDPWFRTESKTELDGGAEIVEWRWAFGGSLGVKPYSCSIVLRVQNGKITNVTDTRSKGD